MKIRILFIFLSIGCFAQNNIEKTNDTAIISVWAFKQMKTKVNGLSIGVANFSDDEQKRIVNGLKIELIGMGIILPLIPKSPIVEDARLLEDFCAKNDVQKVNGFCLSGSGSLLNCLINGFSAGLIGQLNYKVNGFSVCAAMNFAQLHNGIQVAMFNETFKSNGLQAGIFNGCHKTNGAQIGLINTTENLKGLQVGLVNKSINQIGLQLGLFNFTNKTRGLQLGFWNVNTKRSLPIFNF